VLPSFQNLLRYATAAALLAGAVTAYASKAGAAETVVEFDPGQTTVEFKLAGGFHNVHGTFKLKEGTIRFDPATGAASGALVIDAASGNSGNNSRDSRMHKSILESQKYPEIAFTPRHVKGQIALQGDSQVEVEGTFNIHGADHALTLVAKVNAQDGRLTAVTHFAVPYVQWGMKNPSTFILRVSETVDIDIHASGSVVRAKS
jgi:polyisoprenoid-binding protein YceI